MSRNQLDRESSPYLQLHKDNPIHWRPWGEEAFDEAQRSNKPVLLSIGYTACHWCHVMNAESFSDAAIADFINENYIAIKVDREERPDIDLLYQTATSAMGGQGGWPLNAFLTPQGEPFLFGTYIPLQARSNLPGFQTVLENALSSFREKPEGLAAATAKVREQLSLLWSRDLRQPIPAGALDIVTLRMGQRFDMFFGGVTGTPKFPTFASVDLLFRGFLRTGQPVCYQLVHTTLLNICLGGLYDHVGGGIFRYANDEQWRLPHFEKMLFDNAQFIDAMIPLWQFDRKPIYRARIAETIGWVLREMMVEQAFASSLDADTEGEEGRFYTWSEAEIDAALAGTFAQKFKTVYDVANQGPHQGRNVLHRLAPNGFFPQNDADEALLAKQRELLLAARDKRVRPKRDDKVQADWNGMMIAALANAGAVFRNTEWTVAAIRAFEFVERALGDGDRLYHSWHAGQRQHIGFLDDYAHMARAAMALWQSTNDRRYLDRAQAWVRALNEHFWDFQNGGYFQTSDESDPLFMRARPVFDQFIPSGNGVMPAVLSQLYRTTMDQGYRDRSNALIEAFSGEVNRAFVSLPTFINSFEMIVTGLSVAVVGPLTSSKTHELASAVRGRASPNNMLLMVASSDQLPPGHPAYGKPMVGGQPTAYIVVRNAVSEPITNPVTLSQVLYLPVQAAQVPQPQMPPPVGRA